MTCSNWPGNCFRRDARPVGNDVRDGPLSRWWRGGRRADLVLDVAIAMMGAAGTVMQRVPIRATRFRQVFRDAELSARYAKRHAASARRAGAQFGVLLNRAGHTPRRVLDVGSGSGDTPLVLAERFPDAELEASGVAGCHERPRRDGTGRCHRE